MFFKAIRFVVIAGFSVTRTLNAAEAAGPAPQTQAASTIEHTRSVFDQFLDAWDFGNYQEFESQYKQRDWSRPRGFSFMGEEWCIQNAACGSPKLIQKFKELSEDLSDKQLRTLTFLADIAENGKPKHTIQTRLLGHPPAPYAHNPLLNKLKSGNFQLQNLPLKHEMIYKIFFYTELFSDAFNIIKSRTLNIVEPLEKEAYLLRAIGTPSAKYNYALMLRKNQVNVRFDGTPCATKQERFDEEARLYRDANTPEAQYNYAHMLLNNQVRFAFDGTPCATKQDRFDAAAHLCRKANTPEAQHGYAFMLMKHQVNVGFDGKTPCTTEKERFNEAARLLRKANTPLAKHNFLYGILLGFRETFSGDALTNDVSAYHHIITTITHPSYEKIKESSSLLELAYEKLGDLDKAFNTKETEEALGGTPTDFDNESADDAEEQDPPKESQKLERKQEEAEEQKRSQAAKKARQAQSKAARQKQQEQTALTFDVSDNALAKARAAALQSWKERIEKETPDHKAKRHARIQGMLSTSCGQDVRHNFNDYTQIFENGASIQDVPERYRRKFHDLIQGIKEKNSDGTPHMLSGDYFGFKLIARSITKKDRIVYYFDHTRKQIVVVQCSGHYDDT